jgi:hypothetical protein
MLLHTAYYTRLRGTTTTNQALCMVCIISICIISICFEPLLVQPYEQCLDFIPHAELQKFVQLIQQ